AKSLGAHRVLARLHLSRPTAPLFEPFVHRQLISSWGANSSQLFISMYFSFGEVDHVPQKVSFRVYANRAAGGYCHHRSLDRPAIARRTEGARCRQPNQMRE